MIIKTENLKRMFQVGSERVEALKGINLSVEKGEFLSIMGPSGSGKTTLMNIIGCLDTPSEGTYFLNNKFHLLLLSLMFLLIFTHMRLGMSEIFEDYIHQEKVKKLLNTFILIISVIIPVAAIVSMVILGL